MRSKKKRRVVAPLEVDLIPVLSCMFLLVPALLLAMEAANWASVRVQPPSAAPMTAGTAKQPTSLRVEVREDGFAVSLRGCSTCGPLPLVPRSGEDGFEGLRELAVEIKASHPELDAVYLGAEATTSLQTLIETMDALRGHGCSLGGVSDRSKCLFPSVTIDA